MRVLRIKLRPFARKANILTIELLLPPTPPRQDLYFMIPGMGHGVPKLLPSVSSAKKKALISSPVLTKAVKTHCAPGRPHHPHQNATLLSCFRSKHYMQGSPFSYWEACLPNTESQNMLTLKSWGFDSIFKVGHPFSSCRPIDYEYSWSLFCFKQMSLFKTKCRARLEQRINSYPIQWLLPRGSLSPTAGGSLLG